jgi:hypothetical protein
MSARLFIAFCVLMAAANAGAQFVAAGGAIPVVANNPGENGTYWRSDVSILNTGDSDTSVVMMLFPEIIAGEPAFEMMVSDEVAVPANSQTTLTNIVQSEFGLIDAKGGLSVFSLDGAPLVLSSRVFTYGDLSCDGSYGQDVNSVQVRGSAWASGLQHDSLFRTNLGIFLPTEPLVGETVVFTVEVYDADGELVGSGSLDFGQAGLQQTSLATFGVGQLLDGYAVITTVDQSLPWYAYASRVDQTSGDAVFRIARGYVIE